MEPQVRGKRRRWLSWHAQRAPQENDCGSDENSIKGVTIGGSAHLLYLYLSVQNPTPSILSHRESRYWLCILSHQTWYLRASLPPSDLELWKPTLGGLFRRKQFGLRQHILATLFQRVNTRL